MYLVVEYADDNLLAVIPENWLDTAWQGCAPFGPPIRTLIEFAMQQRIWKFQGMSGNHFHSDELCIRLVSYFPLLSDVWKYIIH